MPGRGGRCRIDARWTPDRPATASRPGSTRGDRPGSAHGSTAECGSTTDRISVDPIALGRSRIDPGGPRRSRIDRRPRVDPASTPGRPPIDPGVDQGSARDRSGSAPGRPRIDSRLPIGPGSATARSIRIGPGSIPDRPGSMARTRAPTGNRSRMCPGSDPGSAAGCGSTPCQSRIDPGQSGSTADCGPILDRPRVDLRSASGRPRMDPGSIPGRSR